jgi:5-methyltetrahydropteroyltriglutamate--homocysteine methyltransferase
LLLETTIAGSLPKPAWLAEPARLWAPWRLDGDALREGKRDATLLAVKLQEDAGIDIVTDGEQARQHFVHGFLEGVEGIDFARRVPMGIRNNRYEAMVPTVTGELRRRNSVHLWEADIARRHTNRRLKFTLPGPMTIVDTIADCFYGDRIAMAMAFAEVLNEEARELAALGVDVIQFDEPAFNVYLDEVVSWGIAALHRAAAGLGCTTAVHICYGYGIPANIEWKAGLGPEWRQYDSISRPSLRATSTRSPWSAPIRVSQSNCLVCSTARMCWSAQSTSPAAKRKHPSRWPPRLKRHCATSRRSDCTLAPIADWRLWFAVLPSGNSQR